MIFIYHSRSFAAYVFITKELNGLLAQLVERCIGIAEVMGSTPVQNYLVFWEALISLLLK